MKVYHRCGGCEKKQGFINSEKFRVNANGNRIDAKNVSIHGICQYMKGLEHRKYHPMNMNFSWKMILNLLVNMEMI